MEYIKICGLKDIENVKLCSEYGADAIGFVYNVPSSPRNLDHSTITDLLSKVPHHIKKVVVFKPIDIEELKNTMLDIVADYYQIHTNFNLSRLLMLPIKMRRKIIVGLKINKGNFNYVIHLVNRLKNHIYAFLIDNSEGHGNKLDHNLIKEFYQKIKNSKFILAGGIDIYNVENIINTFKPFGIDVSSSLETTKGEKDSSKIINFLKKVNNIKKLVGN
ncbi:MAG: phosphoribosylanthranilate isomerase [Promethearchaeota archaeon]|nr:MAG: phosphoribosylanthranilate isomerase [Candidatus Lokiarchaeota archaeon]